MSSSQDPAGINRSSSTTAAPPATPGSSTHPSTASRPSSSASSAPPTIVHNSFKPIEPPPIINEDLCFLSPSALHTFEHLKHNDIIVFRYGRFQSIEEPLDATGSEESSRRKSQQDIPDREIDLEGVSRRPTQDLDESATSENLDVVAEDPEELPKATYRIVHRADLSSSENLWINEEGPSHVRVAYMQTFQKTDIQELFDASKARFFPELVDNENGAAREYINTVRIRTEKKDLNLFVGLPYLGPKGQNQSAISSGSVLAPATPAASSAQDGDGLTLPQYSKGANAAANHDSPLRVWQSWHILIDNSRIALFKSPQAPSPKDAPLFYYQESLGALHALTQIIGNHFLHEERPLAEFRAALDEQVAKLDLISSEHATLDNEGHGHDIQENKSRLKREKIAAITNLEERLQDISTIVVILQEQKAILKKLTAIASNHKKKRDRPAFANAVQLPHLRGKLAQEQLPAALRVLQELMEGRQRLLTDMEKVRGELRGELRTAREGLGSGAAHTTTVEMKDIMKRQGQTVTVFTFVTAAFLPLGFFSQYLGMNIEVWSGVNSHEEFWRIAGPITVFLVLLLSYFLFRDDDEIKSDLVKLTPWKWNHPNSQGGYLRRKARGALDWFKRLAIYKNVKAAMTLVLNHQGGAVPGQNTSRNAALASNQQGGAGQISAPPGTATTPLNHVGGAHPASTTPGAAAPPPSQQGGAAQVPSPQGPVASVSNPQATAAQTSNSQGTGGAGFTSLQSAPVPPNSQGAGTLVYNPQGINPNGPSP